MSKADSIYVFFPVLISSWYYSRNTQRNVGKSPSLSGSSVCAIYCRLRCSGSRALREGSASEPAWGPGRNSETFKEDPQGSSQRVCGARPHLEWEWGAQGNTHPECSAPGNQLLKRRIPWIVSQELLHVDSRAKGLSGAPFLPPREVWEQGQGRGLH